MAILVIYIVLGILYESFIHPLTILSGLPSAAFGALLTLQIFGLSLDLYGFVGVIMLIGIVKKNAIMMVDFAIEREREGHKTAAEAIYEGCLVRFRPIMMTTMAALMGTLPIAFGLAPERIRGVRWASPLLADCLLAARHAVFDAGVLHLHGFLPGLAGAPFRESRPEKGNGACGRPRFGRLEYAHRGFYSAHNFRFDCPLSTVSPASLDKIYLSLRTIDPIFRLPSMGSGRELRRGMWGLVYPCFVLSLAGTVQNAVWRKPAKRYPHAAQAARATDEFPRPSNHRMEWKVGPVHRNPASRAS